MYRNRPLLARQPQNPYRGVTDQRGLAREEFIDPGFSVRIASIFVRRRQQLGFVPTEAICTLL